MQLCNIGISLTGSSPVAGGGLRDETFTATATATGPVFIGPLSLRKITRIGGTSQTVTLYDHAVSATGTAIYAETMDAGEIYSFDPPFEIINGVYMTASVGDGSVEFEVAA